MKRLLLAPLLVLGLFALPACTTTSPSATRPTVPTAEPKASEASIKALLVITDSQKVIDGMMGQVDAMMKAMLAQATNGQPLNAAQQAAFDKYQAKIGALMREEISWSKLEPMYVRIYQDSLSQQEVDGMLAFYKTAAGQALIKKLPVLVQRIMAEMPAMVGPIMQKIQPLAQELGAEMQAAAAVPAAPTAPAPAPSK